MIKSKESIISEGEVKNSLEGKPLTFEEVASIIESGDSENLREVIEGGKVPDINMESLEMGLPLF